jgi:hypothetical protein
MRLERNVSCHIKVCLPVYMQYYFGIGKATGYGLEGSDSLPGSTKFVSSPHCPDRFCGSLSLLSNEYRELFPWG